MDPDSSSENFLDDELDKKSRDVTGKISLENQLELVELIDQLFQESLQEVSHIVDQSVDLGSLKYLRSLVFNEILKLLGETLDGFHDMTRIKALIKDDSLLVMIAPLFQVLFSEPSWDGAEKQFMMKFDLREDSEIFEELRLWKLDILRCLNQIFGIEVPFNYLESKTYVQIMFMGRYAFSLLGEYRWMDSSEASVKVIRKAMRAYKMVIFSDLYQSDSNKKLYTSTRILKPQIFLLYYVALQKLRANNHFLENEDYERLEVGDVLIEVPDQIYYVVADIYQDVRGPLLAVFRFQNVFGGMFRVINAKGDVIPLMDIKNNPRIVFNRKRPNFSQEIGLGIVE